MTTVPWICRKPTLFDEGKGRIHTESRPFCLDPACPCHDDEEAVNRLNTFVVAGLLTKDEAHNIRYGRSLDAERSAA